MYGTDAQNPRRRLTWKLQHMVAWMRYNKIKNYDPLNTTEEWESEFNEDIFNDFDDDIITVKNYIKEEETSSGNKKIKYYQKAVLYVRIPYFDGTAYAWPGVKETFELLLEAQGLDTD